MCIDSTEATCVKHVLLACFCPCCAAAGGHAALAADNGIYIGASVGQANVEIEDIGGLTARISMATTPASSSSPASGRSTGWPSRRTTSISASPRTRSLDTKLKAEGDGISAFAVGFLPLGPVDVFAKGGLISWDTQARRGFDEDGTDLAYGVGAQFRFWAWPCAPSTKSSTPRISRT